MKWIIVQALTAALLLSLDSAGARAADENADLKLIPDIVKKPPPKASAATPPTAPRLVAPTNAGQPAIDSKRGVPAKAAPPVTKKRRTANRQRDIYLKANTFIENAFTSQQSYSGLLVPTSAPATLLNRTSLDVNQDIYAWKNLQIHLSDRLSVFEASNYTFGNQGTYRNDLREGYLSLQLGQGFYLEAGRIKVVRGLGVAFSPSDYYKPRSGLSQTSADPLASKINRMGTVMVNARTIFAGGSAAIEFSPKLVDASPILSQSRPPTTLDLLLGQTNFGDRMTATATLEVSDLSPQFSFLHDSDANVDRFGFSMSKDVSNASIVYLEWSGAMDQNLSARALNFGTRTNALSAGALVGPQADAGRTLGHDLVVGGNWSMSEPVKLSFAFEYNFHQFGFTKNDWTNWLSVGSGSTSLASQMWYVRSFATDRFEPLMQHQFYLRGEWDDAFMPYLVISGFAFLTPYDGSSQVQLSVSYADRANHWTYGAFLVGYLGGPDTVFGSVPQRLIGTLQIVKYF